MQSREITPGFFRCECRFPTPEIQLPNQTIASWELGAGIWGSSVFPRPVGDTLRRMNTDPREVIAFSPMSRLQMLVVGVTIALNALDGFDILSISFASPGIATEWGIDRAAL